MLLFFGRIDVVRYLIDQHANKEAKNNSGNNALLEAACNGHAQVVCSLIDDGADKEAKNGNGNTALNRAARNGRFDVVLCLVERGADKNSRNNEGNTPLIRAATYGHVDVVVYLVKQGAVIDAENNQGHTALSCATQGDHTKVVQCLVEHGAGVSDYCRGSSVTLTTAAKNEYLAAMQYLVSKRVNFDVKDAIGRTALTFAAAQGLLEVVCYLIGNGVDINATNRSGNTALIEAARHGHLELVKYLAEQGADTSVKDSDGSSALILLLQRGDSNEETIHPITKALLDNGTSPDQVNNQGESAQLLAERNRYHRVIHLINAKLRRQQAVALTHIHQEGDEFIDWLLSDEDVKPAPKAFERGSPGTLVYKAKYGSIDVIMKKVEITSEDDRRRFQREVRVWKEFSHPSVVKFYGANNRQGSYYMVSEYAENGNLIDYLKKEERPVTWRKLKEVAYGLKYLHDKKKVIHGDLKGNNIVVNSSGTAMLVDFGMSFFASGSCSVEARRTQLGAMHWRAPEYAIEGALRPSFDSDVYSLGMCIIQAVKLAEVPWGEVNLSSDHIRNLLCKGERVIAEKPVELTVDQWELVEAMIAFNRTSRPRLEIVIEKLEKFADDEEEASAWQSDQDFKTPGPCVIS